jgi:hypothetical protein
MMSIASSGGMNSGILGDGINIGQHSALPVFKLKVVQEFDSGARDRGGRADSAD